MKRCKVWAHFFLNGHAAKCNFCQRIVACNGGKISNFLKVLDSFSMAAIASTLPKGAQSPCVTSASTLYCQDCQEHFNGLLFLRFLPSIFCKYYFRPSTSIKKTICYFEIYILYYCFHVFCMSFCYKM